MPLFTLLPCLMHILTPLRNFVPCLKELAIQLEIAGMAGFMTFLSAAGCNFTINTPPTGTILTAITIMLLPPGTISAILSAKSLVHSAIPPLFDLTLLHDGDLYHQPEVAASISVATLIFHQASRTASSRSARRIANSFPVASKSNFKPSCVSKI